MDEQTRAQLIQGIYSCEQSRPLRFGNFSTFSTATLGLADDEVLCVIEVRWSPTRTAEGIRFVESGRAIHFPSRRFKGFGAQSRHTTRSFVAVKRTTMKKLLNE